MDKMNTTIPIQSDWNEALYKGARTPYATVVTYSCGLGRKLFNYDTADTIEYDTANFTCQWDRTWFPEGQVGNTGYI